MVEKKMVKHFRLADKFILSDFVKVRATQTELESTIGTEPVENATEHIQANDKIDESSEFI